MLGILLIAPIWPEKIKGHPNYDVINRAELEIYGKVLTNSDWRGVDLDNRRVNKPIPKPKPLYTPPGHTHNFNTMLGKPCNCDPTTGYPYDYQDRSDPSDTYYICDESRW